MLIGTVSLLIFGTVMFLVLEQDGVLHGVPRGTQVLIALFHSTSSRTAGFNTVEIGKLTNATLFITMLLMLIGAGPCSTGGGFKVSTFMVLVIRAWTTFRGHLRVHVFRRSIPRETVDRATATALLFTVVSILALTTLLVFEQSEAPHAQSQGVFMDAMFEVISALGTVGLSTGMTTNLSEFGRLIIIILMFVGRLGPISVFVALSSGERERRFELAQEEPLIG
jgi:trk system potassium uptake protein TrkH